MLATQKNGLALIEAKNLRERHYPDRSEIRKLPAKAEAINGALVLIARRIPDVTFRLLDPCGVIVHRICN